MKTQVIIIFAISVIFYNSNCLSVSLAYANNIFILKSPMAIFTDEDKTLPCFIFPKGTSLYYDSDSKYFDGFSRYIIYVNISDADTGDNSILERSSDKMISPVWLYKIDKDTLEFILHNFPLSKSDLSLIIKESGITKDDLADIIRSMPDN